MHRHIIAILTLITSVSAGFVTDLLWNEVPDPINFDLSDQCFAVLPTTSVGESLLLQDVNMRGNSLGSIMLDVEIAEFCLQHVDFTLSEAQFKEMFDFDLFGGMEVNDIEESILKHIQLSGQIRFKSTVHATGRTSTFASGDLAPLTFEKGFRFSELPNIPEWFDKILETDFFFEVKGKMGIPWKLYSPSGGAFSIGVDSIADVSVQLDGETEGFEPSFTVTSQSQITQSDSGSATGSVVFAIQGDLNYLDVSAGVCVLSACMRGSAGASIQPVFGTSFEISISNEDAGEQFADQFTNPFIGNESDIDEPVRSAGTTSNAVTVFDSLDQSQCATLYIYGLAKTYVDHSPRVRFEMDVSIFNYDDIISFEVDQDLQLATNRTISTVNLMSWDFPITREVSTCLSDEAFLLLSGACSTDIAQSMSPACWNIPYRKLEIAQAIPPQEQQISLQALNTIVGTSGSCAESIPICGFGTRLLDGKCCLGV